MEPEDKTKTKQARSNGNFHAVWEMAYDVKGLRETLPKI